MGGCVLRNAFVIPATSNFARRLTVDELHAMMNGK
jgi:hypothetical protein